MKTITLLVLCLGLVGCGMTPAQLSNTLRQTSHIVNQQPNYTRNPIASYQAPQQQTRRSNIWGLETMSPNQARHYLMNTPHGLERRSCIDAGISYVYCP